MATSHVIGLRAETFIHPGIGQAQAAIDLPVAREETTGHPYIAGSSFKGALRDLARIWRPKVNDDDHGDVKKLFGDANKAGELLISDVRLLLLPVRSLTESFRWATCPLILRRFFRDLKRADPSTAFDPVQIGFAPAPSEAIVLNGLGGKLFLEELVFERGAGILATELADAFASVTRITVDEIKHRLVVLHDDVFAWIATNGLPVRARNALDDKKKVSKGALWYEEYLPPETIMYALIGARASSAPDTELASALAAGNGYLQLGGDETVGLGWFSLVVPQGLSALASSGGNVGNSPPPAAGGTGKAA